MARARPNLLVTGTPGTGKTTCEMVASAAGLRHVNVGELVKAQALHIGWGEEYQCWVIDEDKVGEGRGRGGAASRACWRARRGRAAAAGAVASRNGGAFYFVAFRSFLADGMLCAGAGGGAPRCPCRRRHLSLLGDILTARRGAAPCRRAGGELRSRCHLWTVTDWLAPPQTLRQARRAAGNAPPGLGPRQP